MISRQLLKGVGRVAIQSSGSSKETAAEYYSHTKILGLNFQATELVMVRIDCMYLVGKGIHLEIRLAGDCD